MALPGALTDRAHDSLQEIIDRRNALEAEGRKQAEEIARLTADLTKAKADLEGLEVFRPILENAPTRVAVNIEDRKTAMLLEARARKVFGKAFGDFESDDKLVRKRARMNVDTIALACIKYGLGHWDGTHREFLSSGARVGR